MRSTADLIDIGLKNLDLNVYKIILQLDITVLNEACNELNSTELYSID